jgi:Cys-tRNA(Pro)/Cys-tRNA(Cys) deacylase
MAKITKTNAMRLLDKGGVSYEVVAYEVDENDLAATHVAEQLGQDIRQVFKTLVLRGDRTGVFVCVVPGGDEVDLKKAARASGNKSAAMIHQKELLPLTGYIRGGCTAVGMKKQYPGFIHESCFDFPFIYVSAGMRGLQLKVDPRAFADFARLTAADLICNV